MEARTLEIDSLVAQEKFKDAANIISNSKTPYTQPLNVKLAHYLALSDLPTLRKILAENGYKIDFASNFEKEPHIEQLFWMELAHQKKWDLFKQLVENNTHHIAPTRNQQRTVLTDLFEKDQYQLYFRILNNLFLQNENYPVEDLHEIINHYHKAPKMFQLHLFQEKEENYFAVVKILLKINIHNPKFYDLTENNLFFLALNKNQKERDAFCRWLLENERYKSFDVRISPAYIKAILGETSKEQELGFLFIPYEYAIVSGAIKLENTNDYDFFKRKGRERTTFFENCIMACPERLIEILIEMKAFSLLDEIPHHATIELPSEGETSLLSLLFVNKQYKLYYVILKKCFRDIVVSPERSQELITHILDPHFPHDILPKLNKKYPEQYNLLEVKINHNKTAKLIEQVKSEKKLVKQILKDWHQETINNNNAIGNDNAFYAPELTLTQALDILKKCAFVDLNRNFKKYNYKINFGSQNSLQEQIFFAQLAKLSAEHRNWELFEKIISNSSHHIQPVSSRKETIFTVLLKNGQWRLYSQLLENFSDHLDASASECDEIRRHYIENIIDMLCYDFSIGSTRFLEIAIKLQIQIDHILIDILEIDDDKTRNYYFQWLRKDGNYKKINSTLREESILACLGSAPSPDVNFPYDSLGLVPQYYSVIASNNPIIFTAPPYIIESGLLKEKILQDIAVTTTANRWIRQLISLKEWHFLKTLLVRCGSEILSFDGYRSFLTDLANAGRWDLYHKYVIDHFDVLKKEIAYLRLNEVILNILEHPEISHDEFLFQLKQKHPDCKSFFKKAVLAVKTKEIAAILLTKLPITGLHSNPLPVKTGGMVQLTNQQVDSISHVSQDTLIKLAIANQQTPVILNTQSSQLTTQQKPQQHAQSLNKKNKPTPTKPSDDITDADVKELEVKLKDVLTSLLFTYVVARKDKTCIITLRGEKAALQTVTAFLKKKKISKFGSLLQLPLRETDKPTFKYLLTFSSQNDLQTFIAALSDQERTETLKTDLQNLSKTEETPSQQTTEHGTYKKDPTYPTTTDQIEAWIKAISPIFCKPRNFKSLIKWNEAEKCFDIDISSNHWIIKKYRGSKADYKCYKLKADFFKCQFMRHLENDLEQSKIATVKLSEDEKTLKFYPLAPKVEPQVHMHELMFQVFADKKQSKEVPLPPEIKDTETKGKETKNKKTEDKEAVTTEKDKQPASLLTEHVPNSNESVPEQLKELFRQLGELSDQEFSFLRIEQHQEHPQKWFIRYSPSGAECFDNYHSELFFKALNNIFKQPAPEFFNLFQDNEDEIAISINMAKKPASFPSCATFAAEYEKLNFNRLIKIIFNGLLKASELEFCPIRQDRDDPKKWIFTCPNQLITGADAKALSEKMNNIAPGFMTLAFADPNNNNNNDDSIKFTLDMRSAPSESNLKRLSTDKVESLALPKLSAHDDNNNNSPSHPEHETIPTEGEVFTALVGIMQHLSDEYLDNIREYLNLIKELPLPTGNEVKDKALQLDLYLYITRILCLLASAEAKHANKVIDKTLFWDLRNIFRHPPENINLQEFANNKEFFTALGNLLPLAEAKNVRIIIDSDKKDTLMQNIKKFLEHVRENHKGRLRNDSKESSEYYQQIAEEISKLKTDNTFTVIRKKHAILNAISLSGEYKQAPKPNKKVFRNIGHKGFGKIFGLFADNLYDTYVKIGTSANRSLNNSSTPQPY